MNEEIIVDSEITLRQLSSDEAVALAKLIDANREYLSRWLPWAEHSLTVADSEKFIREGHEKRMQKSELNYGIFVDGKLVGHITLRSSGASGEPEIGYWLDNAMGGRGITTRATKALTDFGFNEAGYNKIIICAEPENIASNRVAEKSGYRFRGLEHHNDVDKDFNIWQATAGLHKKSVS